MPENRRYQTALTRLSIGHPAITHGHLIAKTEPSHMR